MLEGESKDTNRKVLEHTVCEIRGMARKLDNIVIQFVGNQMSTQVEDEERNLLNCNDVVVCYQVRVRPGMNRSIQRCALHHKNRPRL